MQNAVTRLLLICLASAALVACDQLGIETPAQTTALRDAEGRAIGGACRHAGRALEDCYQINPKAIKASVYNGWRDMDAYMRENKLETITPEYEPKNAPPKPERDVEAAPKQEKQAENKTEAPEEKTKESTGAATSKSKPATSGKGKSKQM